MPFFDEISDNHLSIIQDQKMFFVATAAAEGRINLSPKGMDSLRVIDRRSVAWLNLTGSGNETSAHVQDNGRMTIMFCGFDEKPIILRLYGIAKVYHSRDAEWERFVKMFPDTPGARQIFQLQITSVQKSCGYGVPIYDYVKERDTLRLNGEKKEKLGIEKYWKERNQTSIDGLPTRIMDD